ncbi:hypothetical protein [Paenibacillus xylanexedens]|uniref:hypothetical protein n=1 Tax=Paenibacillus xylanexedens TaxID=528191 RepID=UPI0011A7B3EF|nr:hypothetical protein [Paenibacillus xylanexedens]
MPTLAMQRGHGDFLQCKQTDASRAVLAPEPAPTTAAAAACTSLEASVYRAHAVYGAFKACSANGGGGRCVMPRPPA